MATQDNSNKPIRPAAEKKQPQKPQQKGAAPKQTAQTQAKKPQPAKTKSGGGGIGWLALLLTLALAGAGYYFYMEFQKRFQTLNTSVAKLDKAVSGQDTVVQETKSALQNEINSALSNARSQIEAAAAEQSETLAKTTGQFSETNERLNSFETDTRDTLRTLEKQIGKNRPDWLIAEAEYLLSVANQRLQLAGDIDTALIALDAADQRLKENGDAALYPVRTVIAKDINKLKNTAQPDRVGLASSLLALEANVNELPVLMPHAGKIEATSVPPEQRPEFGNWDQMLSSAWENLKSVAVVRRSDRPIQIMLTPEQVEVIRQSLVLKLEMARLAMVQENEQLYKANLESAKAWLERYFDKNAQANIQALEEIDRLAESIIKTPAVDISESLRALRAVPILKIDDETISTTQAGGAS